MLEGKVAIVTGASRGIGAGIAAELAASGARVVCVARTLHEGDHRKLAGSLDTTVATLRDAGADAHAIAADLASPDECARVVAEARAVFGPVDILVNNAALTWFAEIASIAVDKWMHSFAINVHAPMVLAQHALADMIPRGSGTIINISSGSARGPGRGPYPEPPVLRRGVLYGTEKAALERFSQGLAEEVYPHGVTVAALSPSQVVLTPGVLVHASVYDRDDAQTEPASMMGRACVLLASQPLDEVTGRVCYSQQILQEFGWITDGRGAGIDTPGSGYSLL
jgi:citronellol/citronellal dehydrogenase